MDQANDSDDYELMPKKEIDKLRKEISGMKKNPYGVSDKGQDLQLSIERLNSTINKFIAILEDAQQDIIDEYQESKPVEKLNQILDQNETIARALVSINDNLKGSGTTQSQAASQPSPQHLADDTRYPDFSMPKEKPQSPLQQFQQPQQQSQQPQQPSFQQQPFQQQQSANQNRPMQPNMNRPQFAQQQPMQSRPQYGQPMPQQFNQPQQFQQQPQYQQQFGNIPPLDGLSLDNIPPLDAPPDSGMLPEKKKKFLGLI